MRKPLQHSRRRALAEELHSRPFSPLTAPAEMLHFAFAPEEHAADRDPHADLDHLNALLAILGAKQLDAAAQGVPNHHEIEIAGLRVKWERHTEFVSLTVTSFAQAAEPFEPWLVGKLSQAWLDHAPGPVICATLLHVEAASDMASATPTLERLMRRFDPSSVALSAVTDREAMVMGDFRLDANGYMRFAIIALDEVGPRRLGRIAQRLMEIETYRTMAMLALPASRRLTPQLNEAEAALAELVSDIARSGQARPDAGRQDAERQALDRLTEVAADLERMKAETAFRFSAAAAYEALVWERLQIIREERVDSYQLFKEFMMRRFNPAMRTCASVSARLDALSDRVNRAASLLRTRVDVSLESQNQKLLESMDRRASLQLRLQETVEGLSIVAISYYALNLAAAALAPIGAAASLGEKELKAILVAPVVLTIWALMRRVKRRLGGPPKK